MAIIKYVFLLLISFFVIADEWPHPNISQATFALAVENRVPQTIVDTIDNEINKIYFYTNLRNLADHKITHRWIYNNKNMAEVNFFPKGNRWRVYSSKNLWHSWTGDWTVQVVDEKDNILLEKSFVYTQAK